jgi:hypothetical protein
MASVRAVRARLQSVGSLGGHDMDGAAKATFAKRVVHAFVWVALGLLFGKVYELVAGPDIAPLEQLQQEASNAVGAFDPWNIFHSYVCNVESAGMGGQACGPVRGQVAGLNSYAAPERVSGGAGVLSPVVALFAVVWQLLAQPTAIGKFLALLQFAGGLFAMLWASRGERREAQFWLFALPLGTVALACLFGWSLQLVMLAGLGLFGWFTRLAGLCCGSGTLGYLVWQFCLKAVELKAHETAVKKIVGE